MLSKAVRTVRRPLYKLHGTAHRRECRIPRRLGTSVQVRQRPCVGQAAVRDLVRFSPDNFPYYRLHTSVVGTVLMSTSSAHELQTIFGPTDAIARLHLMCL